MPAALRALIAHKVHARACCSGSVEMSTAEMVPILVEVEVKPERLDEFLVSSHPAELILDAYSMSLLWPFAGRHEGGLRGLSHRAGMPPFRCDAGLREPVQILVLRGTDTPATPAALSILRSTLSTAAPAGQVYKDAAAAAAHRDFPHFKLWTDFKVRVSRRETHHEIFGASVHPTPRCAHRAPRTAQADGVVSSKSSKPKFTPWGFSAE